MSKAPGRLAVVTAQKRQPRVQVSPIIMKVAVPLFQHSPMFGQRASSQTVASFCPCDCSLIQLKRAPPGKRTLSHGGLAGRVGVSSIAGMENYRLLGFRWSGFTPREGISIRFFLQPFGLFSDHLLQFDDILLDSFLA